MRENSSATRHNIHASVPKLVDNVGDMFSDELSGGGGLKDTKPELSHLGKESILQEPYEVEVGLKTCDLQKEQIECGVRRCVWPPEEVRHELMSAARGKLGGATALVRGRQRGRLGCRLRGGRVDSKMRKTTGEAKGGAALRATMERPEDFGRVESEGQQAEQGAIAGLRVEEELVEKQSELDSGLQAEEPAQEQQQLAVLGHCLGVSIWEFNDKQKAMGLNE
ncbi:hypothetical protein B0H16DRAFT_1473509 [Mycena metata]|uniref:Uncharacterized protein n=1 Tax=Mycena metata TaxID=1033252 RepID=A0AAD7HJE4_9AGAR|nr:hypothetical protein B0H16DRAFT_1473509 [Mycena metata]